MNNPASEVLEEKQAQVVRPHAPYDCSGGVIQVSCFWMLRWSS